MTWCVRLVSLFLTGVPQGVYTVPWQYISALSLFSFQHHGGRRAAFDDGVRAFVSSSLLFVPYWFPSRRGHSSLAINLRIISFLSLSRRGKNSSLIKGNVILVFKIFRSLIRGDNSLPIYHCIINFLFPNKRDKGKFLMKGKVILVFKSFVP